jgi:hypothetical protein
MARRLLFLFAIIMAVVTVAGCGGKTLCAWYPTHTDLNWGRSYEMAKYNQILNPEASENLDPVEGVPGRVSETVVAKYEKSFAGKAGKQSVNLNLGSIARIGESR